MLAIPKCFMIIDRFSCILYTVAQINSLLFSLTFLGCASFAVSVSMHCSVGSSIRFFFCLSPFMKVHTILMRKCFVTILTCIRLFICMCPFMFLRILNLCKLFVTVGTCIRFFACMSLFVNFHTILIRKCFVTI